MRPVSPAGLRLPSPATGSTGGARRHGSSWVVAALALVALLEILLFSRSHGMLFSGDGFYYLSRRLLNAADVLRVFTTVDHLEEYRPLPFVLFSFVLHPLFGHDPAGHRLLALGTHLANTGLVYLLARRLAGSAAGSCAAAFFFGTHSVAFFITYGLEMTTEFTHSFFYLVALLAFLERLRTGRSRWMGLALLAFGLSLLSKEAAVTLVATAPAAALVVTSGPTRARILGAARAALPLAGMAFGYLALLLTLKGGHLFPPRPAHPHHAVFSFETLASKHPYLPWSFNALEGFAWNRASGTEIAIQCSLAAGVVLLAVFAVRALARRDSRVAFGLLWFAATLSPVLFLPNLTMMHYLYMPLVGMAWIVGAATDSLLEWRQRGGRGARALTCMVGLLGIATLAASWRNGAVHLKSSWLAIGSTVSRTSLDDLRASHPVLPPGTHLYFLRTGEKELMWLFDFGRVFSVFYGQPAITASFEDRGATFRPEFAEDPKVLVLQFVRPHLYDVTAEFKAEMRDRTSVRLLPLFRHENISFGRWADAGPDPFDTPGGKPAFVLPVVRARVARHALVTLGSTRVRFGLPRLDAGTRLEFGLGMAFDAGDGAEGRVYFRDAAESRLLYARFLDPARREQDRRWFDESIDLTPLAGRAGDLVVECHPGPAGDDAADWLVWSVLKIVRGSGSPAAAAALEREGSAGRPRPADSAAGDTGNSEGASGRQ